MKTSNAILLALIIVIFTVPLLLAFSLKSKIKKNDYIVKQSENQMEMGRVRSGTFTTYKSVKVISTDPHLFACKLILSSKMDYSYRQVSNEDSVQVFTANDTLYIKYNPATKNEGVYARKVVTVHLPTLTNLDVDGAVVVIDALPASNNLSVSIKNNGEIKDGTKKQETEQAEQGSTGKGKVSKTAAPDKPKDLSDRGNGGVTANVKQEAVDFKALMIFRLL